MTQRRSQAYVDHLLHGPFTDRVDLWAEADRYFHQMHSSFITCLQSVLLDDLIRQGFYTLRQPSLQMLTYIQGEVSQEIVFETWDYDMFLDLLDAQPDAHELYDKPKLDMLLFTHPEQGGAVMAIELISPRIKNAADISKYRKYRHRFYLERNITLMEIDFTRSIDRSTNHPLVNANPYHVALHEPGSAPRVIVSGIRQQLPAINLPLRAMYVDLQAIYTCAYRNCGIASLLSSEVKYMPDALPYPTLLTDQQKQAAVEAVSAWRGELTMLAGDKS